MVFMFVSCPEIPIEKNTFFESAWNKLRKIDDTCSCYLGSMLVFVFSDYCRHRKCFSEKRGGACNIDNKKSAVNLVNFKGEFHETSTTLLAKTVSFPTAFPIIFGHRQIRVPNLTKRQTWDVDGSEIRRSPVEVGGLSMFIPFQGFISFIHPWWLFGISSEPSHGITMVTFRLCWFTPHVFYHLMTILASCRKHQDPDMNQKNRVQKLKRSVNIQAAFI